MKTIKPLANMILVKLYKPVTTNEVGLILTVEEKQYYEGIVIDKGPGIFDHSVFVPTNVEINDEVLVDKNCRALKFKTDNDDYLLVENKYILAKIN